MDGISLKDVVTIVVLALVWITEVALVLTLRQAIQEIRRIRSDVPKIVGAGVLMNLLIHAFTGGPKND